MLMPCAVCSAESIHFIFVESCNEEPIGEFWFCSYECLLKWLTEKGQSKMTPEEMKAKLLELAKPIDDFMRANNIASFSLDNGSKNGGETFDISAYRRPLPNHIKCVMEKYGSIYVEVKKDDATKGVPANG